MSESEQLGKSLRPLSLFLLGIVGLLLLGTLAEIFLLDGRNCRCRHERPPTETSPISDDLLHVRTTEPTALYTTHYAPKLHFQLGKIDYGFGAPSLGELNQQSLFTQWHNGTYSSLGLKDFFQTLLGLRERETPGAGIIVSMLIICVLWSLATSVAAIIYTTSVLRDARRRELSLMRLLTRNNHTSKH